MTYCKMEFIRDHNGEEILLKDESFQVMMEWEKPYMQACIDALKPFGDVLEIGFGCGYSATHIQTYHPTSHTIIEYHPAVIAHAKKWAQNFSNITLIENTWQKALSTLGVFDCIFFDDYPLESLAQAEEIEAQKKQAISLVKEGQKSLLEANPVTSLLKTMTYTQKELDEFFLLFQGKEPPEASFFLRFFSDLKKNCHITEELFDYAVDKLVHLGHLTEMAKETFLKEANAPLKPVASRTSTDRFFTFFNLCLQNHMKEGSVFSCYLEDPTSKFEDKRFYEEIINNPFLEYKETKIAISPPPHCKYYKFKEALVITIKKF